MTATYHEPVKGLDILKVCLTITSTSSFQLQILCDLTSPKGLKGTHQGLNASPIHRCMPAVVLDGEGTQAAGKGWDLKLMNIALANQAEMSAHVRNHRIDISANNPHQQQ